jgi:hypothetical protein
MTKFIDALFHLVTFKKYTILPRWLEIGYGLLSWGNIIVMCIGFYNILTK